MRSSPQFGFRALVLPVVVTLIVVVGVIIWRSGGFGVDTEVLIETGRGVYANHCAACHGADLEGQPNWRQRLASGRMPAPPHDDSGHTWHHPDAVLIGITKEGLVPGRYGPRGYESDMPAFKAVLTDDEIMAVLTYIKSTWPEDIRARQREIDRRSRARR